MPQEDRHVYPHPDDFAVKRPEYRETDDGLFEATIRIPPFSVEGTSSTKAGARRAALRNAEKTYRSYNPSYEVSSPYPDQFVDQEGTEWELLDEEERDSLGDYKFTDENGSDYVDIETMLLWDVRVAEEVGEDD